MSSIFYDMEKQARAFWIDMARDESVKSEDACHDAMVQCWKNLRDWGRQRSKAVMHSPVTPIPDLFFSKQYFTDATDPDSDSVRYNYLPAMKHGRLVYVNISLPAVVDHKVQMLYTVYEVDKAFNYHDLYQTNSLGAVGLFLSAVGRNEEGALI